jgi:hypothetical protein
LLGASITFIIIGLTVGVIAKFGASSAEQRRRAAALSGTLILNSAKVTSASKVRYFSFKRLCQFGCKSGLFSFQQNFNSSGFIPTDGIGACRHDLLFENNSAGNTFRKNHI